MSNIFAAENRVAAAQAVHHDTPLFVGQEVIISGHSTGLFGENGVISSVGYNRLLGEVITIELVDRLTEGSFSRTQFRIRRA